MSDLLLTGLFLGVLVGFGLAGISVRLLRIAAVIVVGGLIFILADQGIVGLHTTITELFESALRPHARFIAGAFLGLILGRSLVYVLGSVH